jgi:hypothetical protein
MEEGGRGRNTTGLVGGRWMGGTRFNEDGVVSRGYENGVIVNAATCSSGGVFSYGWCAVPTAVIAVHFSRRVFFFFFPFPFS